MTDSSKHIDGKGSPKLAQDETRGAPGVIRIAAQFVRKYCWRSILISAGVLVPCFWHRRIVAADLGISLISSSFARDEVAAGRVKLIELEGAELFRELGLAYRRDRTLSVAAKAFITVSRQLATYPKKGDAPAQA